MIAFAIVVVCYCVHTVSYEQFQSLIGLLYTIGFVIAEKNDIVHNICDSVVDQV